MKKEDMIMDQMVTVTFNNTKTEFMLARFHEPRSIQMEIENLFSSYQGMSKRHPETDDRTGTESINWEDKS